VTSELVSVRGGEYRPEETRQNQRKAARSARDSLLEPADCSEITDSLSSLSLSSRDRKRILKTSRSIHAYGGRFLSKNEEAEAGKDGSPFGKDGGPSRQRFRGSVRRPKLP
jgi:hypothetical protein